MTQSKIYTIKILSFVLGLLLLFPVLLLAQDSKPGSIVGTWNASAETDNGSEPYVWMIMKSGEAFSGQISVVGADRKYELEEIAIDGDDFGFAFKVDADGDEILIKVAAKLAGKKLDGTWAAVDENGKELATGKVTAVKQQRAKFAGGWNAVATLPDGDELESTLTLNGKNSDLSGAIDIHDKTTDINKITSKGKTLRLEFDFELEGDQRDVVVEAKLDSASSLSGKWILKDDSGGEEASGDWKATRESSADAGGVVTLFDGTSLDNFRGYSEETIGAGWKIKGDILVLDGKKSGDIITKKQYGNFELKFDWKISEGGNSGVMYRVSLGDKKPYLTGPEYQVLDDSRHKDGSDATRTSGSLYALYKPENKTLNEVGEWNSSKIVLNGNNVQHWLNGTKVVDAEIGSDDWNAKVAASKFKDWPKFGKNKKGHIAFQDHGNLVWYRNIKITPLK